MDARVSLTSMTRLTAEEPPARYRVAVAPAPTSGTWRLQDAKARFSELVRVAHRDGPQWVTLHGRESVVVLAAEDYRRLLARLEGGATGQALVDALAASPWPEVDLAPARGPMQVRDVDL
jgi:prevent-host-death family protein